ncbi:hypothetical protein JCGZ_23850 [Jatropha curcas]|uniref:Hyccin n=1 Tax=Jatropha curcas TaxID=180498 RepID=A0A067L6P5_JATCU|nr:uncharacterized protein LOC105629408 [Jatropha curcas]KDP42908.1 hypothetical protein JCGZ_23850 [Jatropha curcas]
MSQDSLPSENAADTTNTTTATSSTSTYNSLHRHSRSSIPVDFSAKIQSAIQSLTSITKIPSTILSAQDPASSLLHDSNVSTAISALLREPDSGAGDNNLCRWFYDTFQSTSPQLQLVVLRFVPIIAGLYLSRVPLRKPLAGFEAVLLALYAHETTSRNGQAIAVNIPDLSNSSVYHETKETSKNNATDLNLAVISPSLEPHGTVRSTRRARIVGVALELYFSKLSLMPIGSKIDFCEFCELWAGQDGEMYKEGYICKEKKEEEEEGGGDSESGKKLKEDGDNTEKEKVRKKEGRIALPWDLLQPALRILGHCLLGPQKDKELFEAACGAIRSLYARSLHDINPKAILATGSLLRLSKMAMNPENEIDYTEITMTDVITL